MSWREWADAPEAGRMREAGRWHKPRGVDAAGPEGKLGAGGPGPCMSHVVAKTTPLGLTQHPTVVGPRRTPRSTGGAGVRLGSADRGLTPPVHAELEGVPPTWKTHEQHI